MPKFSVDKLISKYGLQGGRNALTPYALENTDISGRQLRKLYTELRDIANKRIKRAERAGWPEGGIREQKAGEYLSDPESPADRKFALYNAVDMTI